MWCCCCTPEEQVKWENQSKYVIANTNMVRRLGKKCITNKHLGRKNRYLEGDLVVYFEKAEQSLHDLKKMAVPFLLSNGAANQIQRSYMRGNYQKLQLELGKARRVIFNSNVSPGQSSRQEVLDEDTGENCESSSLQIFSNDDLELHERSAVTQMNSKEVSTLNEINENLKWQLRDKDKQIDTLNSRIKKLQLRLQAQDSETDEEEPLASQARVTEPREPDIQGESELPGWLKDVAASGAQALFGQIIDTITTDSGVPQDASANTVAPIKKNKKKKQPEQEQLTLENPSKALVADEAPEMSGNNTRKLQIPGKFLNKIRNKNVQPNFEKQLKKETKIKKKETKSINSSKLQSEGPASKGAITKKSARGKETKKKNKKNGMLI